MHENLPKHVPKLLGMMLSYQMGCSLKTHKPHINSVGKNYRVDHGFRLVCQRSWSMMEKERAGKV